MLKDVVTVGILGGALHYLIDKIKSTPAPITPVTYPSIPEYRKGDPFGVKGAQDLKPLLDNMFNPSYLRRGTGDLTYTGPARTEEMESRQWTANIAGISGGAGTRQNVFGFDIDSINSLPLSRPYLIIFFVFSLSL